MPPQLCLGYCYFPAIVIFVLSVVTTAFSSRTIWHLVARFVIVVVMMMTSYHHHYLITLYPIPYTFVFKFSSSVDRSPVCNVSCFDIIVGVV
jgi:hypothetical protein